MELHTIVGVGHHNLMAELVVGLHIPEAIEVVEQHIPKAVLVVVHHIPKATELRSYITAAVVEAADIALAMPLVVASLAEPLATASWAIASWAIASWATAS